MSSYQKIVTGIKGVAKMMLPDVDVISGTIDLISQEGIDTDKPIITLWTNFQMDQDEPDSSTKSATIFMQFGLPDDPDSSSEEVDNIIASTDILIDQFLDELLILYGFYEISISDIKRVSFYKAMAGTFTGYTLEFNLMIGVCSNNIFPDLKTYQNKIGREIPVFKWYGITQRT